MTNTETAHKGPMSFVGQHVVNGRVRSIYEVGLVSFQASLTIERT